jgi:hypothetical protein
LLFGNSIIWILLGANLQKKAPNAEDNIKRCVPRRTVRWVPRVLEVVFFVEGYPIEQWKYAVIGDEKI